jgi:tRNA(fMet)-specific endonuclease VapC
MHYLLDTNILSDLVKRPQGMVFARIAAVGGDQVCTNLIVAAELRYGAAKRGSEKLTKQLEAILATLPVLPLEAPTDRHYGQLRGQLRAALERQGNLIGPNDLLIAAHALALGAIPVTDNTREFEYVRGLVIENWLQPG